MADQSICRSALYRESGLLAGGLIITARVMRAGRYRRLSRKRKESWPLKPYCHYPDRAYCPDKPELWVIQSIVRFKGDKGEIHRRSVEFPLICESLIIARPNCLEQDRVIDAHLYADINCKFLEKYRTNVIQLDSI